MYLAVVRQNKAGLYYGDSSGGFMFKADYGWSGVIMRTEEQSKNTAWKKVYV